MSTKIDQLMPGIGSEYTLMGHSLVPQITSFTVLRWAPWLQTRRRHVTVDFFAKAPLPRPYVRKIRLPDFSK